MAQAPTQSKTGNGGAGSGDDAPDYEKLSRQLDTLKADLSSLTEIIGGLGKAERDRLLAAGEARYAQAKGTAESYLHEGERYVREQPGTALGIAAALGFLVGFVMTSRR